MRKEESLRLISSHLKNLEKQSRIKANKKERNNKEQIPVKFKAK